MTAALPAEWLRLQCLVYIDGQRVEDGSTPGALDSTITVLAGLTVQWGRTSTVDQPAVATCGFELMDLDGRNGFLELVKVGRHLDVDAAAPGRPTVRVFSGRITDARAVWDAAIGGVRVTATAVDLLGELGSMIAATPALGTQTLAQRLSAVLTSAGYAGPIVIDANAQSIEVGPKDIDKQAALQSAQDLTAGLDLALWAAASVTTGPFLYVEDAMNRVSLLQLYRAPGGFVDITTAAPSAALTVIDACDVLLDPVEWVQEVADVATRVVVNFIWTYYIQFGNGASSVTRRSPNDFNTSATGIRSVTLESPVTDGPAAEELASRLLYRLSYAGWRINGLTMALTDVSELSPAQVDRALVLLDSARRPGRGIQLTNLPEWSPLQGVQSVYLEGGRYTYDRGWTLALDVSNAAGLGDSVEYDELDPTWKYSDVSPTITYNKLIGVGP